MSEQQELPRQLRLADSKDRLKLLIVEDKPADRATIASLCQSQGVFDDLEVAESGADALRRIHRRPPDVLLLECELTDMTGFDLLNELKVEDRPASIMMASDERHALRAIEAAATDYLIKPIHAHRIATALERARALVQHAAASDSAMRQLASALRAVANGPPPALGVGERLIGERNGRLYFIAPSEVEYIEAEWNYVTIHSGDRHYISRDSLKRLTPLLQAQGFVRISRSVTVNLRRVDYAEREGRGVLGFVLQSGVRLISSRGMRLGAGAELSIARHRRGNGTRKTP